MAKITEDYCSYEVAKLLKEKGFTEPCYKYYDNKGDICGKYINPDIPFNYSSVEHYLCPSQSMVMKWLREEKNILIYVYPIIDLPVKNNYTFYWRWDGKKKRHDAPHIGDKHNYESFEDAVEASLKYCLENLI